MHGFYDINGLIKSTENYVIGVFLDFSKAFDLTILLDKLYH